MGNLRWYLENILDYVMQMLPCMLLGLALFFLLQPWRKRRLEQLGLVTTPWREAALGVFVCYGAGLAALTLFPAYFWTPHFWQSVLAGERSVLPAWSATIAGLEYLPMALVPFHEISTAFSGVWRTFMLLGNMGVFFPVGFFAALLWRNPRWWKSLLAGFVASVTIEFIQFFIGRSTDIDDVILNTAGALVGFWTFGLLRTVFPNFCSKFQCYTNEEI